MLLAFSMHILIIIMRAKKDVRLQKCDVSAKLTTNLKALLCSRNVHRNYYSALPCFSRVDKPNF